MTKTRSWCILAGVAIFIAAFFLLHRADKTARTSFAVSNASGPTLPAGTWMADTGDLFQFRPDGTGRSRDPNTRPPDIHYFEWTCDGTTFTIYYAPRSVIGSFIAHQTGLETSTFSVDELTTNRLTLADGSTKIEFTATTDALLDADP